MWCITLPLSPSAELTRKCFLTYCKIGKFILVWWMSNSSLFPLQMHACTQYAGKMRMNDWARDLDELQDILSGSMNRGEVIKVQRLQYISCDNICFGICERRERHHTGITNVTEQNSTNDHYFQTGFYKRSPLRHWSPEQTVPPQINTIGGVIVAMLGCMGCLNKHQCFQSTTKPMVFTHLGLCGSQKNYKWHT